MAEIVLGVGSSHSPQLNIPPEQWTVLQEKDRHDRRFDYEAWVRTAPPGLEAQLSLAVWRERYERCHAAMANIRAVFESVRPDVVLVFGDDQHEQFLDDNMPMFSIYWGDTILVKKAPIRDRSVFGSTAWHELEQQAFSDTPRTYPAAAELAQHLIHWLRWHGVDIAVSHQLREEFGIGHAFAHLYRRLLPDGLSIPVVPVMINAFYPPNQPTPARCWEVGEAVAEAIAAWPTPARVAVVASGGLSHFRIDEALDRTVLEALRTRDRDQLTRIPEEQLVLGTSEVRCWIAAGAALPAHLRMELLAYEPCYRSLAGTGCGMAFAVWR